MAKPYDHKEIEGKWRKFWEEKGVYKTENPPIGEGKPKYYVLDMFPYPSGAGLHVGHPRGYIGSDVLSRMRRMQGFNVLHPMGFDAFGLPAEQYAIQTGEHPSVITEKAIDTYKKQLEIIGLSYDWSREVRTIDPEYYKWTQWIFLKLYDSYFDEKENKAKPISELIARLEKEDSNWSAKNKNEKQDVLMNHRLAYEGYSEVNWCPELGTVLANDEIVDGGDGKPVSERGGFPVEKKNMRQWFLRITAYADRLLSGLDGIDWPEHIKEIQKNWIGKSVGAEIEFSVKDSDEKIKVFTTRPDTLFGVTFVAVPGEKEKFTGSYAINPANGEEVPIWEAPYVMEGYGTGAVMGVPAHDERDFEFAKKFGLPIKSVVADHDKDTGDWAVKPGKPNTFYKGVSVVIFNKKDDTVLCLEWKKYGWKTFITGKMDEGDTDFEQTALREVYEETGYKNLKLIHKQESPYFTSYYHDGKDENRFTEMYRMYFELVDEEKDNISEEENSKHVIHWVDRKKVTSFVTASYDQITARKIADNSFEAMSCFDKEGILINSDKFSGIESEEAKSKITEFVGGKMVTKYKMRDAIFARQRYWGEPIPLKRVGELIKPLSENELPLELPNVSSYKPAGNGESPLAGVPEWVEKGLETNTMPGWAGSSWYFLRYMDPKNSEAFAGKDAVNYWQDVDVYVGGAEHATGHLLYSRFWHKFLYDLGYVPTDEPFKLLKNQGLILASDGRKMSKRWGNVVNPDEMVDRFGADSFRLYEMFIGPFDQYTAWNTDGLVGTRRFLERVWKYTKNKMIDRIIEDGGVERLKEYREGIIFSAYNDKKLEIKIQKTIKKVTDDIENFRFNTAISSLMIIFNELLIETPPDQDGISTTSTLGIPYKDLSSLIKILAPFAPHMTEELWHELGETSSIHKSDWPKADESKLKDEKIKIAVQVNGKVRDEIEISPDANEEEAMDLVLSRDIIKDFVREQKIKKFIYVKGKIVNVVI